MLKDSISKFASMAALGIVMGHVGAPIDNGYQGTRMKRINRNRRTLKRRIWKERRTRIRMQKESRRKNR